MSWSIEVIGRAKAVANKVTAEFGDIKGTDAESAAKRSSAGVIAASLAGFGDNDPVSVKASGHQIVNQLSIEIAPLPQFVDVVESPPVAAVPSIFPPETAPPVVGSQKVVPTEGVPVTPNV